jgi:hypothetical protein
MIIQKVVRGLLAISEPKIRNRVLKAGSDCHGPDLVLKVASCRKNHVGKENN